MSQQPQSPLQSRPTPRCGYHVWLILALLGSLLLVSCASTQATSTNPTPTVNVTPAPSRVAPTAIPTQAPTSLPTQKPTPTTIQVGPPILGADISAFIAKYGHPTSASGGEYKFSSPDLDIFTASSDPAPYTTRTIIILVNGPDTGWSVSEAQSICMIYAPSDAVYKRTITISTAGQLMGLEKVYYGASLGKQLPASEFTDEQANPDAPGTFSITLGYDPANIAKVLSCSLQTVLQG